MQAKQAKQKIDSLMLQLQDILEVVGLDEHERIQNAFNALAIELDDVVYPEDLQGFYILVDALAKMRYN